MRYFKNRYIIVDIITIFISLLLLISGSIIYDSYKQNKKSLLKIGSQFIDQEHDQIIEKLSSFLSPQPFIQTTEQFVEDGLLTLNELNSLSSFMHVMLTAYPEFNNVYIADEHGNIFFETRYSKQPHSKLMSFIEHQPIPNKTRFVSEIINRNKNQYVMNLIFKDVEGNVLTSIQHIETQYNPLRQTWYLGAKRNPNTTWIDFAPEFSTKKEILTLAHSVMVRDQFRGVIAADIDLKQLDAFLKKIAADQQILVITDDQYKLISSTGDASGLNFVEYCKNQSLSTSAFEQHNENIYYCTDFQLSNEKKWKIISVTPTRYFISDLESSNKRNLLFSFFYLVIGLILVIVFARRISNPIIKLARATQEMSHFHFNKKINFKSQVYEINVLLEALHNFRRTAISFSKYVPKTLVEKLIDQKMIAKLGGQKKELTIMFSDVEQFTQIAEQSDPSFLIVHMSEYLECVTKLIHEYSGNVDKYIGDSVMAFWGAPLDNLRHAHDACCAALACSYEINQLNEHWKQQGKPVFNTRFGLAMGMVVVGNVGSTDRLNYTVLGDRVNLAARLQTLNKIYGTQIIVNEAIYEACKNDFIFRILDRVVVKGKSQPVLIYELLGMITTNEDRLHISKEKLILSERFNRAFEAIEQGDNDLAHELFSALQETYPDDLVVKIHLERLVDQNE